MNNEISCIVLFTVLCISTINIKGQFNWQTWDPMDEIRSQMNRITEDNCYIQQTSNLYLDPDTVSHLPDIKEININPVLPNRTALLNVHNLALSRGFYFSYILQKADDDDEPGLLYYYMSVIADVASNPKVNASAVYYAFNRTYTPSYRSFFNKTMPLFAPRAYRTDDYNDPQHLERISTLNTIVVRDHGAIPPNSRSLNYTTDDYRINEWYRKWLPDEVKIHDTKTTYQVRIRFANNTNETFTWHGPPGADENPGPVKWVRPYFDCQRSNKWIMGAATPIPDLYPRHTGFRHIEYPNYVAVSVVELDYERIDINQCPLGKGNEGPNRFAGTSRCKNTTECEPLHGWGFRRGGYQCKCRPGHRLPNIVRRPYLGEVIERSTSEDYHDAFDCEKIGYIMSLPHDWKGMDPVLRMKYLLQHNVNLSATNKPDKIMSKYDYIDKMLKFMDEVRQGNCSDKSKYSEEDLVLDGDIVYGAEIQFENEARMALRLANFLSAYLQIVDPNDVFAGHRLADKVLSQDQVTGEVLSILFGDTKIWGAGVYWDRSKFNNLTYFAPYAYKKTLNTRKFFLEDMARLEKEPENFYMNQRFFKQLKSRWATNFDDLELYYVKMHIRYNSSGISEHQYDKYPTKYRAAELHHGQWSRPFFDCYGFHKQWIITYSAPFFGWDSLKNRLEFKGVVSVDIPIISLDINQCPSEYHVPNAFSDSHKCDRKSSYCVPILGRGFETGGYKCMCKQGYEYPYENPITYYDGQLVEAEFQNVKENKPTRYETLECRLAGAHSIRPLEFVLLFMVVLLIATCNNVQ